MGVNRQSILGRIGKIEMRQTPQGKSVCEFSVAVTEKYKDKEDTQGFRCVALEKQGEIINQYFSVGSEIYLEGKTVNRSYDDNNGNKKYISEVVVREFSFTGGSKSDNQGQQGQGSWEQQQQPGGQSGCTGQPDCDCPQCGIPF
jgi:single-strand DNA-binding protein